MIQEHYDQLARGLNPLAPLQNASDWNDEDLLPHILEAIDKTQLSAFLHVHNVSDETFYRIKEAYPEEFI